jgi:hypothetical protein
MVLHWLIAFLLIALESASPQASVYQAVGHLFDSDSGHHFIPMLSFAEARTVQTVPQSHCPFTAVTGVRIP